MSTSQQAPRPRFLGLLRRDILELDAAELDFGIHRVLNQRLGQAGRYVVPCDGGDAHFHWAITGSHCVKIGERCAGYAYQHPGGPRVRLLVLAAREERDNAKGTQRHCVPAALVPPGPAHPGEWRLAFEHGVLSEDELARERGMLAICSSIGRAFIDVLHALKDWRAAMFEKPKFVMQALGSWLLALGADGRTGGGQAAGTRRDAERDADHMTRLMNHLFAALPAAQTP